MRLLRRLLRMMGRRRPLTRGSVRVRGAVAPVTIGRDRYGIPLIRAENLLDTRFALGFCHAQDRAGQLELLLRMGRGTLAEWVGKKALPVDRLLRRIGFRHFAHLQWHQMSVRTREIVDAYVAGINEGLRVGLPERPHEFVFMGTVPTPWEPADVLGLMKLQCWFMACNWDSELTRLRILSTDGIDALRAVDPNGVELPGTTDVQSRPGVVTLLDRLNEDLQLLGDWMPKAGGSNNWVIGPAKSATGRPIVANDPHLSAAVPAPWYLVSMHCPEGSLVGASFVGSPTVPNGHNGTAAWGVTAGLSDNTDLFIEDLRRGAAGWEYRQGDKWLLCEIRKERIVVKGGDSVVEEIPHTPRGPVIGPTLAETGENLSLRAIWLDPLPVEGWLVAGECRDWESFRGSFERWPGFPMNLVYADTSGKTGWQFVGQLPVRKRGNGLVPLAGWDDRNGWHAELVPFDRMPRVEDPAEGFVATANNRPCYDDRGVYLGGDWLDPYRFQVIAEDLGAMPKVSLADCGSVQQSVRCIPWREIRDRILSNSDPRAADAVRILRDWDGLLTADSRAATVYQLFMVDMSLRVVKAKCPRSAEWALGGRTSALNDHGFFCFRRYGHLVALINNRPDGWFTIGWERTIAESLRSAVDNAHGQDWGTVRPLRIGHQLMGRSALRSAFDLPPFPFGGDEHTPNHAWSTVLDPLGSINSLPNLRSVIDVGNWSASRWQLAGGQSGNPTSPHYDDLLPLWRRGEGVAIPATAAECGVAAVTELRLVPESASANEPTS